jgi:hypothetical protein
MEVGIAMPNRLPIANTTEAIKDFADDVANAPKEAEDRPNSACH